MWRVATAAATDRLQHQEENEPGQWEGVGETLAPCPRKPQHCGLLEVEGESDLMNEAAGVSLDGQAGGPRDYNIQAPCSLRRQSIPITAILGFDGVSAYLY